MVRMCGSGLIAVVFVAGCAPALDDHCITTRDLDDTVLTHSIRDMRAGLLRGETLYFEIGGAPAGEAEHEYSIDQWIREEFDGSPNEVGATGETVLEWDGDNPRQVEVRMLPGGESETQATFDWSDDQLVGVNWRQGELAWTEVWTWDGLTATVEQSYNSGTVVIEQRTYAESLLSWPVLSWRMDLPGLVLTDRRVDSDEDGSFTDGERVFDRTVDDDGIPETARNYQQGEVFSETVWGDCQ